MRLRIKDIHSSDDYYSHREELIGLTGIWSKEREHRITDIWYGGRIVFPTPIRDPITHVLTRSLNFRAIRLSIPED